jgi:hypothetical protein
MNGSPYRTPDRPHHDGSPEGPDLPLAAVIWVIAVAVIVVEVFCPRPLESDRCDPGRLGTWSVVSHARCARAHR